MGILNLNLKLIKPTSSVEFCPLCSLKVKIVILINFGTFCISCLVS